MVVVLWQVNHVQTRLQLLRFLSFNLSVHLHDCQIGSIVELASFLALSGLEHDFVSALLKASILHLMVKLVWIPEIRFQRKLLYSNTQSDVKEC